MPINRIYVNQKPFSICNFFPTHREKKIVMKIYSHGKKNHLIYVHIADLSNAFFYIAS